jgi:protease-4
MIRKTIGKLARPSNSLKSDEPRKKTPVGIIIAIILIALIIIPLTFAIGFLIAFGTAFMGNAESLPTTGNVALIPVNGVILTESSSSLFSEKTASSGEIAELIEKADSNPQIKAILLEINSPGGSPVASDEIGTALKKTHKPTVAWIRDIGTSGAYWIASACDTIVANRMSATGSIGVISSYLEFSGLMARYNVSYERLIAGEYKDMGVPYRKLTGKERALLQAQLDTLHTIFIEEVANNRGLNSTYVRKLATGEVFLGTEAMEYGLIDKLGGKADAIDIIKQQTGLTEVELVSYSQQPGFLDSLAGIISQNPLALSFTDIRLIDKANPIMLN